MQTMRNQDIHLLQQQLVDKRNKLLQSIKKAMESNRQTDARLSFELAQDNPDRSVNELLKHVDSQVLGSKAEELTLIEVALSKIRNQTFGECEMCGETISLQRLKVHPEAKYCITCQGRQEHLEKITQKHYERPQPPGTDAYLDDDE
jgi:DnaK suppressor protein